MYFDIGRAKFKHVKTSRLSVSLTTFQSFFVFLRQGFSVALEPILALILQTRLALELTEIHLPLPPGCCVTNAQLCHQRPDTFQSCGTTELSAQWVNV
ncbi:hypothetical protein I79_003981 [Cricetulus griseus]|uniref:Uncharacterized protein n=1 Tax=Cricetulus griseus TaxID=10029 RepID=G3H1F6_CRIGR|nr:hypothetical protein I79_003981 [Cricetulus griseus]